MLKFINLKNLTAKTLISILMIGGLVTLDSANNHAFANDESPDTINLTGTVRDFKDDHPDFEREEGDVSSDGTEFKYGLDKGITTNNLGLDQKPVYAGGSFSTTNKANFDQWYRDVAGVNQKQNFDITLTKQDNGVYRYENTDFFPINGEMMGNEGRNKNFHFTYELHTRFTYNGGEVFNFRGDDDVWVYINGKKVIDIGGVHNAKDANVNLDEVADEIGLEVGKSYTLDFFFAERHTTKSNLIIETTLELETAPEVSGNNACILDWSEVLAADPDGWVTDGGSNGSRDDLYRVYYHAPSGKYVKVTVDQRWGWGGAADSDNDPYPYSPKIVDYSKWGTGGFDGEDMFLFSLKTQKNQVNRLTVEFFNDSQLTDKANVSNLNFTLTDLDGAGNNEARENIIVSAENSFGSTVPLKFYKPEGSVIKDAWINGGSVLGKKNGVGGAEGNIAPVLLGDTHKVEIAYQLAPNSKEKNQVRHMYISDLAWCGEAVNVTPTEEVDIEEITNPDSGEDNTANSGDGDTTSITLDSDGNGILDVNELNPNEDPDGDEIANIYDPDDDGNGISDADEIANEDPDGDGIVNSDDPDDDNDGVDDVDEIDVVDPSNFVNTDEGLNPDGTVDPDDRPDYQDPDDDNDGIDDIDEMEEDPSTPNDPSTPDNPPKKKPTDPDNDGKPSHKDKDSDNNGILDQNETFGTSTGEANSTNPLDYDRDGDTKPDYLDLDDDNDGIADVFELYSADNLLTNSVAEENNGLPYPPINGLSSEDIKFSFGANAPNFDSSIEPASALEPDYHDLDSDGDSIYDKYEVSNGGNFATPPVNTDVDFDGGDFDPDYLDLDSDADGISDEIEGSVETVGSAPRNSDNLGTDSELNYPKDYDDGKPDFQDIDSDDNGKLDKDEVIFDGEFIELTISGTNTIPDFQNLDDDGDGIADIIEIGANPAEPINSDQTDNYNDEIPDYQDTDSDNDGIDDVNEAFPEDGETGTTITVTTPDGVLKTITLKDSDENGTIIPGTPVLGTPSIRIEETTGSVDKFDYQTFNAAD